MRRIRAMIITAVFAVASLTVSVSPAQAFVCHEGQSCDCSVRIKDTVIIPCNQ